eukprot:TRINITY_DN74120_c0_g1_i1.p1 TRINITY_DN74120_c0_g1~~TRINITY_DN74120_c0_g1_i1.p1  ORF type:complete len:605 (+),score=95.84 TRINITY_DN74120_c0_g1_i1:231-2045(+)
MRSQAGAADMLFLQAFVVVSVALSGVFALDQSTTSEPQTLPSSLVEPGMLPPLCQEKRLLDQTWLYVAHADAPKYMSTLRAELRSDKRLPPEGDVASLSTVVGSWSFLSLVPVLRPRRLLLFDINPAAVAFVAMVISLLQVSISRAQFISFFFGRSVGEREVSTLEREVIAWMTSDAFKVARNSEVAATHFLGRPVEPAVVQEAFERLRTVPPERPPPVNAVASSPACTYMEFVWDYLVDQAGSGVEQSADGQTTSSRRICDSVVPAGSPHNAQVNAGTSDRPPTNVCSLFFGHGWLASESSYLMVRERVLAAERDYIVADFLNEGTSGIGQFVRGDETSVLYLSNMHGGGVVWADHKRMEQKLEELMQRVSLGGGYLRVLCRDRWYAFPARSPHVSALSAVRRALGDDARWPGDGDSARYLAVEEARRHSTKVVTSPLPLVEVVAQDLRVHPGWGFHELNRSEVVHYTHFIHVTMGSLPKKNELLVLPLWERVCILHVLVGEGVPIAEFADVLEVASWSCRRVLVLDHNARSLDFANLHGDASGFLEPNQLRNLVEGICAQPWRQLADCGLVRLDCILGKQDHCRNFAALVEVFGTASLRVEE